MMIPLPRPLHRCLVLGAVLLCAMIALGDAAAQVVDPRIRLEEARGLIHQGHWQPAAERLRLVVGSDPSMMSDDGSASLLLARALEAMDDHTEAQDVRLRGLRTHRERGILEPALVAETVYALGPDDEVPSLLLDAYLAVLAGAGVRPDAVTRLHASYSLLLADDATQERAGAGRRRDAGALFDMSADAGEVLLEWWRLHDPLPATPKNERLVEHMRRVAHARTEYADTTRALGLDDRGITYLRLGPPRFVRHVRFDDARFFLDVVRFGVAVTPNDFPLNEIWIYSNIHHGIYHIFAQDHRRRFRETAASDLLPQRLQNATSSSDRQMNIAVSSLAAMRRIYRDLALVHPDFGALYTRIDDYAMWQEERRMARLAGAPLEVGEIEYRVGSGGTSVPVYINPMRSVSPPNEFVRSSLSDAALIDQQARITREREEPDEFYSPFAVLDVDPLALSVRISRVLEDGATTAHVDWAPAPGALQLERRRRESLESTGNEGYIDIVIGAAAVLVDDGGRQLAVRGDTLAVMTSEAPDGVLMPRTFRLPIAASGTSVRVQADRYAAVVRPGPPPLIAPGPRVQIGLVDIEDVRPLPTVGFTMSDVRPFFSTHAPVDLVAHPDPLSVSTPFPHAFAPSRGSLVLQFHIYQLALDDGESRYALEYEVARREPGGTFQRLLGRSRRDVTAARTEHRAATSNVEEYIILDPAEWTDGSEIRLTIRVEDLVAKRSVERSLDFRP